MALPDRLSRCLVCSCHGLAALRSRTCCASGCWARSAWMTPDSTRPTPPGSRPHTKGRTASWWSATHRTASGPTPSVPRWGRRAGVQRRGPGVLRADAVERWQRCSGSGNRCRDDRRPTHPSATRERLSGFSFLGERGWGYGVSVLEDGGYSWEGGFSTAWSNVPSLDLTVVVLTQRTADETGMPGVCEAVLAAARDSTLAVSG